MNEKSKPDSNRTDAQNAQTYWHQKGKSPVVKPRSSAAEVSARVSAVLELLASGVRRTEIVRIGSREWGVTSRQIDDYIAAATKLIQAEAARTREEALAEHVARRRQIYKRAMNNGDLHAALKAVQDEARLLGLYPSEKHDVHATLSGQVVIYLPDNGTSNYNDNDDGATAFAPTEGAAGTISDVQS